MAPGPLSGGRSGISLPVSVLGFSNACYAPICRMQINYTSNVVSPVKNGVKHEVRDITSDSGATSEFNKMTCFARLRPRYCFPIFRD